SLASGVCIFWSIRSTSGASTARITERPLWAFCGQHLSLNGQAWQSSGGRILTLPPEISPSPRQPSAGRGLGRGASTGLQTWAAVAFRQGGLLSPAPSSQRGEGGPGGGWGRGQDALPGGGPEGKNAADFCGGGPKRGRKKARC